MQLVILLMDKILHDPKDPNLWELWYIPYNGSCRILSISRSVVVSDFGANSQACADTGAFYSQNEVLRD